MEKKFLKAGIVKLRIIIIIILIIKIKLDTLHNSMERKEIGCGAACNNDNKCYVTCNYYPPGNFIGEFQDNVFPLKDNDNKNGITTKIIIFIIVFILLIVFILYMLYKRKKPMNDLNVYLVK